MVSRLLRFSRLFSLAACGPSGGGTLPDGGNPPTAVVNPGTVVQP